MNGSSSNLATTPRPTPLMAKGINVLDVLQDKASIALTRARGLADRVYGARPASGESGVKGPLPDNAAGLMEVKFAALNATMEDLLSEIDRLIDIA